MSGSANDNIVYIGSSVDNHYRNVAAARKNGFRPLSFSICNISTTSDTAAISAAWTKATGPTWEISNITTLQGMSEFVDQLAGQGFVPTILAAAGSAANPFFIAVAEKIPGGYLANFAMSGVSTDSAPLVRPGSIQDINLQAQNRSLAPHAVAVYGSGSSVSYAAVWLPNPDFDKYHLRVVSLASRIANNHCH